MGSGLAEAIPTAPLVLAGLLQTTTGVDSMAVESLFPETNYWTLLFRGFLALALIIAALYASARWILPRFVNWRVGSSEGMAVIDRLPLGGGRAVCVTRAVGRYYLVGVSEGQVRLLAELEESEVQAHYPNATGSMSRRSRK